MIDAAEPRAEGTTRADADIAFGEVLGQMLAVAVVLLGVTAVLTWVAAIAR